MTSRNGRNVGMHMSEGKPPHSLNVTDNKNTDFIHV